MTPTLWVGLFTVVLMLELIRIGITTWMLIYILESYPLRRTGEPKGQASRGARSAKLRNTRESLADQTLIALRGALDEVAVDHSGVGISRAIDALDRYAAVLVEERAQQ